MGKVMPIILPPLDLTKPLPAQHDIGQLDMGSSAPDVSEYSVSVSSNPKPVKVKKVIKAKAAVVTEVKAEKPYTPAFTKRFEGESKASFFTRENKALEEADKGDDTAAVQIGFSPAIASASVQKAVLKAPSVSAQSVTAPVQTTPAKSVAAIASVNDYLAVKPASTNIVARAGVAAPSSTVSANDTAHKYTSGYYQNVKRTVKAGKVDLTTTAIQTNSVTTASQPAAAPPVAAQPAPLKHVVVPTLSPLPAASGDPQVDATSYPGSETPAWMLLSIVGIAAIAFAVTRPKKNKTAKLSAKTKPSAAGSPPEGVEKIIGDVNSRPTETPPVNAAAQLEPVVIRTRRTKGVIFRCSTLPPEAQSWDAAKRLGYAVFRAHQFEVSLHHADLRGVDIRGAALPKGKFAYADLSGALLNGADLSGSDFKGAKLSNADARGADLLSAKLNGADLRGCDFGKNEDGASTDMRHSTVKGAQIGGAVLPSSPTIPSKRSVQS